MVSNSPSTTINPQAFRQALLQWYARGHRPMPWRVEGGATPNPYHIWLAEIMLQQTTVAAVIPYFQRFLQAFPTVQSLAAADIQDVLHLWQGLGYYRRAHLLHRCAQVVVNDHGGSFPDTEAQLLKLPGVGAYTAAVVAATAFNQPATVVDGNVERVVTRLHRLSLPLPAAKQPIRRLAAALACSSSAAAYANAIMELGSQVCTPKNPRCLLCPVADFCASHAAGDPTAYPVKAPKKALPHKHAQTYLITDKSGRIYLRQRPANGLLASLWELPHTGWEDTPIPNIDLENTIPSGAYTHTFTHFKLTLHLHRATATFPAENAFSPNALPPLSTLMKKALHTALSHKK